MKRLPRKLSFIIESDYLRFRYSIGTTTVTSRGFRTKKQFLKMLDEDTMFKIPEQEDSK